MLAARFPGHPAAAIRGRGAGSRRHPLGVERRLRGRALGRAAVSRSAPQRLRTAALVGGGNLPRPGEISLAHHGVLFLDELPEFDRDVLEALREPLETGRVSISRAARQAQFPARFQLVAAMNPCPCGHCGDRSGRCRCTPERIARYRGRISGPLADRIDLKLEVPAPREAELVAPVAGRILRVHPEPGRKRLESCRSSGRHSRTRFSAPRRSTVIARPTGRATSSCATRSRGCCSPRAATIGFCAWRAPSRTSPGGARSPPSTSPRRYSIGVSTPASRFCDVHLCHRRCAGLLR